MPKALFPRPAEGKRAVKEMPPFVSFVSIVNYQDLKMAPWPKRWYSRPVKSLLRRHGSPIFLSLLLLAFIGFAILLRGWAAASSATALRHELASLMNQLDRLAEDLELEFAFMEESLRLDARQFSARDGAAFSARLATFKEKARYPDLVDAVYLLDAGDHMIYRFSPEKTDFITPDQEDLVAQFFEDRKRSFPEDGRPDPGPAGPIRTQAIQDFLGSKAVEKNFHVISVFSQDFQALGGSGMAAMRFREQSLGFIVLRLNAKALSQRILPELGRRYFDKSAGYSDYHIRARRIGSTEKPINLGLSTAKAGEAWHKSDFSRRILPLRIRLDIASIYPLARAPVAGQAPGQPPGPGQSSGPGQDPNPGQGPQLQLQSLPPPNSPPIDRMRFDQGSKAGDWIVEARHNLGSLEKAIALRSGFESLIAFIFLGATYALVLSLIVSSQRAKLQSERERDFIASVSHELKTPIAVILSAAENMEKGIVDSQKLPAYAQMLAREGRRLRSSVESILMVSGIQGGQRGMRSETFALPEAVSAVIAKLEEAASQKSAKVIFIEEKRGLVKASRAMIETAISSLLSNAINYGPEGGEIRILLKPQTLRGRKMAELAIEDQGPGLAPGERRRLFDPFWRGRAAQESRQSGTGLGLFLARRIARIYGGDVRYRARTGGGSVFSILLPEEL